MIISGGGSSALVNSVTTKKIKNKKKEKTKGSKTYPLQNSNKVLVECQKANLKRKTKLKTKLAKMKKTRGDTKRKKV